MEDKRDETANLWRCLDGHWFAVRVYRSRSVDKAGRRDMEKQVLAITGVDVPAAALAAALLNEVREVAGSVSVSESQSMADATGVVSLPAREIVLADAVNQMIVDGPQRLKDAEVSEAGLADFYGAVLSGVRPAFLRAAKPLEPEALAALLLPLERDMADRMSFAGWVVSSSLDFNQVSAAWHGLAVPDGYASPRPKDENRPRAEAMAATLLGGAVASHVRSAAAVPSPPVSPAPVRPAGHAQAARELIQFARSDERHRILSINGSAPLTAGERDDMLRAVRDLRAQANRTGDLPLDLAKARQEQLVEKERLIKAYALALDPGIAAEWPD